MHIHTAENLHGISSELSQNLLQNQHSTYATPTHGRHRTHTETAQDSNRTCTHLPQKTHSTCKEPKQNIRRTPAQAARWDAHTYIIGTDSRARHECSNSHRLSTETPRARGVKSLTLLLLWGTLGSRSLPCTRYFRRAGSRRKRRGPTQNSHRNCEGLEPNMYRYYTDNTQHLQRTQ